MGDIVRANSVILFSAAFVFLALIGTASAVLQPSCSSLVDTCCNADSPGASYTLVAPLNAPDTCIDVTAEGVSIDCNGYGITGADVGYGISSSQGNTTITNCDVSNYNSGIYLNSSFNTITNTTLSSSNGHSLFLNNALNSNQIDYPLLFAAPPNIFGNGSSINTSGNSNLTNLTVTIGDNQYVNGTGQTGMQTVNITNDGRTLFIFDYNFTGSSINFNNVAIEAGTTPEGWSYSSILGIDSSRISAGGKTLYMYNANPSISQVCLKDEDGAVYATISPACTGSNEQAITCDGSSQYGYTCSFFGATAMITGLRHSAARQFAANSGALSTGTPSSPAASGQAPAPMLGIFQGASGMVAVVALIAIVAGAAVIFVKGRDRKRSGQ